MFQSYRKNSGKTTSSLSSGNASIKRPSIIIPNYQAPVLNDNTTTYEINEEEIIDLQAHTDTLPATTTAKSSEDLTLESMSAVVAAAVQLTANASHSKKPPSSLSSGTASIVASPITPTNTPITPRRRFSTRLLFNTPWKKSAVSSPNANTPASFSDAPGSTPSTPGLESCSPVIFDHNHHHHTSIDLMTDDDDDNSTVSSEQQHRSRSSSSATSMSRHSSTSMNSNFTLNDDGRNELIYRGIQVKEIKSTLKTLVISDEIRYPMPEVRLERPGFARINY